MISEDLQQKFSLDCCASLGTVIRSVSPPHPSLSFISRYREPGVLWVNVLSFPFCDYLHHTVWIFPPRGIQNAVFARFLRSRPRPAGACLLIQHNELPAVFPLLKGSCSQHKVYTGKSLLLKPNKKKVTFLAERTTSTVHIFSFVKLLD